MKFYCTVLHIRITTSLSYLSVPIFEYCYVLYGMYTKHTQTHRRASYHYDIIIKYVRLLLLCPFCYTYMYVVQKSHHIMKKFYQDYKVMDFISSYCGFEI